MLPQQKKLLAYTYFVITLVSSAPYIQSAQLRPAQRKSWGQLFCCSQNTAEKTIQELTKLDLQLSNPPTRALSKNPLVVWKRKRDVIREAVENRIHPDTLRYGPLKEHFPLYESIQQCDREFTLFLLTHGADPSQTNSNRKPIILTAYTSAIMRALLDHKADALAKDPLSQKTLLHACIDVDPDIITRYCQAGGDPCAVDDHGQTAFHVLLRYLPPYCGSFSSSLNFFAPLVSVGTPFDVIPSGGRFKNMSVTQIMEQAFNSVTQIMEQAFNNENMDQTEIERYIQEIMRVAEKRKHAIRMGAALTKDTLGIVFAYDGQTTNITDFPRLFPLKNDVRPDFVL